MVVKLRNIIILLIILFSFTGYKAPLNSYEMLYLEITSNEIKPEADLFINGYKGYQILKNKNLLGNKELLTLIDFRKSSNSKRLWVIDMKNKKILYHTFVAHGKNTGEEFARSFSNDPSSYKSSLGFYITGETYNGKHGLSLYLDGIEKGINHNARQRSIVIHGADYVSEAFIKKHGRLGRSFGCPALPTEVYKEIISLLAGKTCLFIYYPEKSYLQQSDLLKP